MAKFTVRVTNSQGIILAFWEPRLLSGNTIEHLNVPMAVPNLGVLTLVMEYEDTPQETQVLEHRLEDASDFALVNEFYRRLTNGGDLAEHEPYMEYGD